MYNRYVPQADGSFLRNRIPDPEPPDEPQENPQASSVVPVTPDKQQSSAPTMRNKTQQQNRSNQFHIPPRPPAGLPTNGNVGNFLKSLLPQNFDTEDLIVVLLLLLMSGNTTSGQNSALLTLGIYLFM